MKTLTLRKEKIFDSIMEKRLGSQITINSEDTVMNNTKSENCIPSTFHGISYTTIKLPEKDNIYYKNLVKY